MTRAIPPRVQALEALEDRVLFSTYLVTGLGDGPGVVAAAGTGAFTATTLRAAVAAANARAGGDVVKFAAGVTGTISLGSPLPRVDDTLIVAGPGAAKLTVQRSATAGANFSVFYVNAGRTATIGGLTIRGGTGTPADGAAAGDLGRGGGVYNAGTLMLARAVVTANRGSEGGGVWNGGKVTLLNAAVADNRVDFGAGAGLFNAGVADLANVTVSGNREEHEVGGGIYNEAGARLTVTGSTIAGNAHSYGGAGGLVNHGAATLSDTTVYGNFAYMGEAGGVFSDGTLAMTNCTVTKNAASYSGIGGVSAAGPAALFNTVAVDNTSASRYGSGLSDVLAYAVDPLSTGNVLGVVDAGLPAAGNKVGVSVAAAKLGPLAYNGGPTQTCALQAGSAAVNAGSNARAAAARLWADQRGLPRVSSGGRVDAGAFETPAAGGASVAGTVFDDRNHDGTRQTAEPLMAGWQVYVDRNRNGLYDAGEVTAFTTAAGTWRIGGLVAGTYRIAEVRYDGWTRTRPTAGYYEVTLATNQAVTGRNFGNYYL
ncbi:MAG TPA: right-handed parallel beta-helix repeat-containing protein [Humisphaera sp.]